MYMTCSACTLTSPIDPKPYVDIYSPIYPDVSSSPKTNERGVTYDGLTNPLPLPTQQPQFVAKSPGGVVVPLNESDSKQKKSHFMWLFFLVIVVVVAIVFLFYFYGKKGLGKRFFNKFFS